MMAVLPDFSHMNRWIAYLCLATSMALVGSYVALSKPLVAAMPVFLLAWLRFGIGGLAMARWLRKPADEPPLTPRTRALLFLESFLGNFLFSVCMLFGVKLTTAVAAGVIMSAIPAVVAVLSAIFLHERIGKRSMGAIALAAIGIGLFSLTKADTGASPTATWAGLPLPLWGNLLIFAAVVCEASYVVIGKRLTQGLGPKRISSLINLVGFVLVTPMGFWAALSFDFASISASIWIWMTGLKSVPAAQAGVFTVMLPVSAAAIGVIFMGERLTGVQMLAFGIALLGLLLATLPSREAAATD